MAKSKKEITQKKVDYYKAVMNNPSQVITYNDMLFQANEFAKSFELNGAENIIVDSINKLNLEKIRKLPQDQKRSTINHIKSEYGITEIPANMNSKICPRVVGGMKRHAVTKLLELNNVSESEKISKLRDLEFYFKPFIDRAKKI